MPSSKRREFRDRDRCREASAERSMDSSCSSLSEGDPVQSSIEEIVYRADPRSASKLRRGSTSTQASCFSEARDGHIFEAKRATEGCKQHLYVDGKKDFLVCGDGKVTEAIRCPGITSISFEEHAASTDAGSAQGGDLEDDEIAKSTMRFLWEMKTRFGMAAVQERFAQSSRRLADGKEALLTFEMIVRLPQDFLALEGMPCVSRHLSAVIFASPLEQIGSRTHPFQASVSALASTFLFLKGPLGSS